MGYYINLPNEAKEEFLERVGEMIPRPPPFNEIPKGKYLVCLVDNGPFRAAGIAVNEIEHKLMTYHGPNDRRPKHWYFVNEEDLEPWLPKKIP